MDESLKRLTLEEAREQLGGKKLKEWKEWYNKQKHSDLKIQAQANRLKQTERDSEAKDLILAGKSASTTNIDYYGVQIEITLDYDKEVRNLIYKIQKLRKNTDMNLDEPSEDELKRLEVIMEELEDCMIEYLSIVTNHTKDTWKKFAVNNGIVELNTVSGLVRAKMESEINKKMEVIGNFRTEELQTPDTDERVRADSK